MKRTDASLVSRPLAQAGSGGNGRGTAHRGMPSRRFAVLALICLLAGCAGAPAPTRCIPGNPGGSQACQAETYKRAF